VVSGAVVEMLPDEPSRSSAVAPTGPETAVADASAGQRQRPGRVTRWQLRDGQQLHLAGHQQLDQGWRRGALSEGVAAAHFKSETLASPGISGLCVHEQAQLALFTSRVRQN
jgi:hypothetical protein